MKRTTPQQLGLWFLPIPIYHYNELTLNWVITFEVYLAAAFTSVPLSQTIVQQLHPLVVMCFNINMPCDIFVETKYRINGSYLRMKPKENFYFPWRDIIN